jgi:hypothetical protein
MIYVNIRPILRDEAFTFSVHYIDERNSSYKEIKIKCLNHLVVDNVINKFSSLAKERFDFDRIVNHGKHKQIFIKDYLSKNIKQKYFSNTCLFYKKLKMMEKIIKMNLAMNILDMLRFAMIKKVQSRTVTQNTETRFKINTSTGEDSNFLDESVNIEEIGIKF